MYYYSQTKSLNVKLSIFNNFNNTLFSLLFTFILTLNSDKHGENYPGRNA